MARLSLCATTADGARLMEDALLRALAHCPSRSRLIDTGGAAGVEAGPGIGVLVGEAIRIRDHGGGQRRFVLAGV